MAAEIAKLKIRLVEQAEELEIALLLKSMELNQEATI